MEINNNELEARIAANRISKVNLTNNDTNKKVLNPHNIESRSFEQVLQVVSNPIQRDIFIEKIKKQLDQGQYHVSTEDIVNKILAKTDQKSLL